MTGNVAARTLFIDPLARADLPAGCQIVQITPLLRELIVSSLALAERYAPASRDERIYELILDEIRGMAILPFGLPEPQSETLRRLCQQVREAPGEAWSSGQAAKACSMSERTLNRHFQQQTSLTWSEWVRRAKLMEALVRLAQGHSVLRVALELGYGSHSAFSAMFRRVMGVAPSDYFSSPGLIGGAERIAQRLQRGARHVIIDTHAPVAFSLRKKRSGYRPPTGCRCARRGYAHDSP